MDEREGFSRPTKIWFLVMGALFALVWLGAFVSAYRMVTKE
jgi:hypothetical protein